MYAGFPVFHVTNAGNTSVILVCFAPNPPPIRGFVTRIFDLGISRACPKIHLRWNTICVELSTFNLPYVSMYVYVRYVSIGVWLFAFV